MNQRTKLDMDVDLARVRALRVAVDLDRGAARREGALALVGVAAPTAGAALASKPLSLLAKSALAKTLSAFLLVGTAAGVSVAVSSDRPRGPGERHVALVAPAARTALEGATLEAAPPGSGAVPAAAPSSPEASPEPRPTEAGSVASTRPLTRRAPPPDAPSPKTPSRTRLADELEDVGSARALLATSPEEALRAADATSGGPLDQERDIIAIRALVALGRTAEARARAERFLARHPHSPFRRTAAQLAGESTRAEGSRDGE
jgi:hypothetical protein